MQQIADWLEKLGMSEYTQRFVENRIDLSVLPDLTDQDLEKLGVLLGDRRKMLRAIRDLGNVSAAVTAPSEPEATEPIRRDDAERRQLTVMFTDLVGSTALSTKVDPEDLRSVIGAYQKCVAKTVARFEGFVAKYMGDGVLIYFGYPHAHEDDAERAVRAGLALIDRRASPLDKRHQGAARRGGMMQFIAGELFSISVAASVDDPADVFGTGEHLAASPCNRSHNSGRGMTVRYRDQI